VARGYSFFKSGPLKLGGLGGRVWKVWWQGWEGAFFKKKEGLGRLLFFTGGLTRGGLKKVEENFSTWLFGLLTLLFLKFRVWWNFL